MTGSILNDNREDLDRRLYNLIIDTGSTLSSGRWVHINQLWLEPKQRNSCIDIIVQYLGSVTPWSEETVLLCLDGVAGAYGILPLMGSVASRLGCKLAIWRELGQVTLTEPWLLPSKLPAGLECVVFQDVISRGTTLVKAIDDLARVNWSVSHVACLIKTSRGSDALEEALAIFRRSVPCLPDFQFDVLLDAAQYLDDEKKKK